MIEFWLEYTIEYTLEISIYSFDVQGCCSNGSFGSMF